MKIRSAKGLTFDDVLLVPKRSAVASRQDVDTSTWLTPEIKLQLPIISANMDTVTEYRMAIAMARAGGIGIIHRFMTTVQQVRQVQRVKRAEGFVVEQPYAILARDSIAKARREMTRYEVGGLVVTNELNELVGLITQRDIVLAPDESAMVSSVMTTPDQIISVNAGISPSEARQMLHENRLEKLPVLDDAGRLVGLITAQDIVRYDQSPYATKDSRGRLRVGAAIGVKEEDVERAGMLLEAGADLLVLDIAHGHADSCINIVKALRKNYPQAQIVAGNVASRDGARELAEAGADAIKVGVGLVLYVQPVL
jgi:IMP dehydrogenase